MAKKYIDAELIKSTRALYFDIDACITELIRARTEQNEENEGKALFRMEGLMVATMQQLDCIIDSLQQEQPCEDLEKEVEWEWVHREKQEVDLIECAEMDKDEFVRFARHFYELGKQSKEPVSEDLEEEMDRFFEEMPVQEQENIFEDTYQMIARHFAEWQKQQMLKDAVEGEVCKDHIVTEKPFYFYQSRLIELPDNLKEGDKVKIVIVKED